MVARAMLNTGLSELRLVRPRDGWPNEKAIAAASGADPVLEGVRLYDSTAEAVADLQAVYASSARPRGMVKRILDPRAAAERVQAAGAAGERVGLLFGPERSGLKNEDHGLGRCGDLGAPEPRLRFLEPGPRRSCCWATSGTARRPTRRPNAWRATAAGPPPRPK